MKLTSIARESQTEKEKLSNCMKWNLNYEDILYQLVEEKAMLGQATINGAKINIEDKTLKVNSLVKVNTFDQNGWPSQTIRSKDMT